MDLDQLRAFVAVVDASGVAHAARHLHLSQPALTRRLQSLESDLGIELFSREQRRMKLTAAGQGLLIRARTLLADSEALREEARSFLKGARGVIRLGATPPMIESSLAPFLGRWRKAHPGIEIHIVENGGSALAKRLDDGDVHLAYVPAGDERFNCQLLYPIHVVAAVPAGHELAARRTVELSALAGRTLCALNPGFGSRTWFDTACREAGMSAVIALDSSSHNVVLALAASGYAIGILPSAVTAPAGVKLLPITQNAVPLGRWTMLAWSRRRYVPPYVMTFVEAYSVFARSHYPGRDLVRKAPKIKPPALSDPSPAALQSVTPRRARGR